MIEVTPKVTDSRERALRWSGSHQDSPTASRRRRDSVGTGTPRSAEDFWPSGVDMIVYGIYAGGAATAAGFAASRWTSGAAGLGLWLVVTAALSVLAGVFGVRLIKFFGWFGARR